MLPILRRHWFLAALGALLLLGYFAAAPLRPVKETPWLQGAITMGVMFLMSLPLGLETFGRALRNPLPPLLAVAMNAGLVPLAACALSVPLGMFSGEMAAGLVIAGATPCTLASAAVWTRRAGGNDAVAVVVTILTNLSCFLVMPFWLLLGTGRHVEFGFWEMAFKLLQQVVAPIVLAQLLRLWKPLADWATARRLLLSIGAQCGVLMIVGLSAIHAGLKLHSDAWQLVGWDKAAVTLAVLAIHLGTLSLGLCVALLLRQTRPDAIAVGISGSQKTLVVGLNVATTNFPGLEFLPMIIYHVGQLLVDTVIADELRRRGSAPP